MTTLSSFGYDHIRGQPRVVVEMPPTKTPKRDLDLRFDALNKHSDDGETLFSVYDGTDRIYYQWHLYGTIMFVDDILSALGYTVTANHGPRMWTTWGVELDELAMKQLADVRFHLRSALDDR